jgi:hypothetical protein
MESAIRMQGQMNPPPGPMQVRPDLQQVIQQVIQQQPQQPGGVPGAPGNQQRPPNQQAFQQLVQALRTPNTPDQQRHLLSILKSNPKLMDVFIKQKTAQLEQRRQQNQVNSMIRGTILRKNITN